MTPPSGLKTVYTLYDEFKEYAEDRGPGEEYELVSHWAEDLGVRGYFSLIDEQEYRAGKEEAQDVLKDLEADPLGLQDDVAHKQEQMETFQRVQEEMGTNMAVAMFMVDALQFFEAKPKEEIKSIAIEIALLGTQGFNPNTSNYKLRSIPNKTFSGYHILAYYYVSFAIALPEMLRETQLPFEKEYETAQTLYRMGRP